MREARHLNKSAALVTPDRALARRVMAALGRWNLEFDDSGGDALMETSAGIFARLVAEAATKGLEPPTLLALLKHPLFRLGGAHGALKRAHRSAGTGAAARHAAASRQPRSRRTISIVSATELRKLQQQETSSLHRFRSAHPAATTTISTRRNR